MRTAARAALLGCLLLAAAAAAPAAAQRAGGGAPAPGRPPPCAEVRAQRRGSSARGVPAPARQVAAPPCGRSARPRRPRATRRAPRPRPPPPPLPPLRQAPGDHVVRDAASLANALRDARVSRVLLAANFTLARFAPHLRRSSRIEIARPVEVLPCASPGAPADPPLTVVDLGDNVVLRVLVTSGGALTLSGPRLRLVGAPPVLRHPAWPDYNPLLLGLLDVTGAGRVTLRDVTLVTRSPTNASIVFERYPPALRPGYTLSRGGTVLTLPRWNLTQQAYAQQRAAHAAAGTLAVAHAGDAGDDDGRRRRARRLAAAGPGRPRRLLAPAPPPGDVWPAAFEAARPSAPAPAAEWAFSNVVLEMPNAAECFAEVGGGEGRQCTNGEELKAALRDPAVRHIALIADIVFHEAFDIKGDAVVNSESGPHAPMITREVRARAHAGGRRGARARAARWGGRARPPLTILHAPPSPPARPRSCCAAAGPTPSTPQSSTLGGCGTTCMSPAASRGAATCTLYRSSRAPTASTTRASSCRR
jgi:hypothetical protein